MGWVVSLSGHFPHLAFVGRVVEVASRTKHLAKHVRDPGRDRNKEGGSSNKVGFWGFHLNLQESKTSVGQSLADAAEMGTYNHVLRNIRATLESTQSLGKHMELPQPKSSAGHFVGFKACVPFLGFKSQPV